MPEGVAGSCIAEFCGNSQEGDSFCSRRKLASECWHSDIDDDEKSAGQESPLADGATQADNVPKHGLIRISGSIGTWLWLTGVEKRIGRGAAKAWDILAIWRWEAVMRGWCLM